MRMDEENTSLMTRMIKHLVYYGDDAFETTHTLSLPFHLQNEQQYKKCCRLEVQDQADFPDDKSRQCHAGLSGHDE